MPKHLLHVYTGDGKGKTSASMGLALRVLGHDRPVLIAQFMKDGTSGELKALATFPKAHLFEGGRMQGFVSRMNPQQQEEARAEQGRAIDELIGLVEEIKPALTVLDELCVALFMRMVSQEDAWRLIDSALQYGDVAATGRYAPDYLKERADYISEIKAVKHPYNEGVPARKGIEF